MLKPVCMSAALAASLAGGQTAEASEGNGQPRSQVVTYGDLNLGSAAGVRTFDRRIGHAADRLCGIAYFTARAMRDNRACRTEAMGSVVEQRARAIAGARTSGIEVALRSRQ